MALLLVGAAVYGVYKAQEGGQDDELEVVNLEGKTPITLLPLEQTLGLFDTPMSTMTYFDGDYKVAAKHLKQRIPEIVGANPWLGGWGARAKGEREVKLWYDETGKEIAPGTFYCFQPGQLPFTSDIPYDKLEQLGKEVNLERKVKIPSTAEVIGKNQALWRVTVVPTADKPEEKFVVVISMSRLLGDPYTFYMLQGMLSRDNEVIAMNPVRHQDFSEALIEGVGHQEAFYVKKVTTNPLWEWSKTKVDPTEKLLFLMDEQWLAERRGKAPNEEAKSEQLSTTNNLITSWFFNTLKPTVGLMNFNLRDRLSGSQVTALDAGNYSNTLLYSEVDYATPELIQKSEETLKRCGTDPPSPLPNFQWDATFSAETDWSSLYREPLMLGEGVCQTLHLPLFDNQGLSVIPNKLSVLFLFTAKHGQVEGGCEGSKLGALAVAPRSGIADIIGSGIVGEVIAKF